MKIAIFGATGRTGRLLVEQALSAGHQVKALARNPGKLGIEHPKLKVLQGDVRDFGAVERTIAGTHGVISALGHPGIMPSAVIAQGVRNMITVMERSRVRRIVTVASSGIEGESGLFGFILNLALYSSQRDHRRQLKLLKASALDWTVVRPIVLTNGPRTRRYRVARTGIPNRGWRISRADLAHFALKCMMGGIHLKSSPSIAY